MALFALSKAHVAPALRTNSTVRSRSLLATEICMMRTFTTTVEVLPSRKSPRVLRDCARTASLSIRPKSPKLLQRKQRHHLHRRGGTLFSLDLGHVLRVRCLSESSPTKKRWRTLSEQVQLYLLSFPQQFATAFSQRQMWRPRSRRASFREWETRTKGKSRNRDPLLICFLVRKIQPMAFIQSTVSANVSTPYVVLKTEATIVFADIAGFTAWSSAREPGT